MSKVWTKKEAVANPITIDDIDLINFPHVTVSFSYFRAAAATTPAVPGAGTVTVTGRVNGSQAYSAFADGTVDATDVGDSASRAAPLNNVKATPAGITTATHYVMTITSSVS
jgi:hypothetical protein